MKKSDTISFVALSKENSLPIEALASVEYTTEKPVLKNSDPPSVDPEEVMPINDPLLTILFMAGVYCGIIFLRFITRKKRDDYLLNFGAGVSSPGEPPST